MSDERRPRDLEKPNASEPAAGRPAAGEGETEPGPIAAGPEPEPETAEEEAEAAPRAREPERGRAAPGGYRGALAPRDDRLAAPWLIVVVLIFLMMFVLAFLEVPSRFIEQTEPIPPLTPPPTIDVSPEPGPASS